ncbi:HAD family hydrolase [Micromonospora sp. NBC_01638]|uniref:HAD family hydrolase n=1 Tax=Micromonospora sp. NBC_01638 TaxID=2975982 RepID=UPI00386B5350|nr:HAD family phosphatase [Micromonospora sp. NBC_01638]
MTYDERVTAAAVVFDYGGVLTSPVRDSIAAWLKRDGIDPVSFSRTLKAWMSRSAPEGTPIHRLETGELAAAQFDTLLAAELVATDGGPVAPNGLLQALFAEMRPDPLMFDLVEELKSAGVRVALLSNSWGNTYPRELIDALFDPVVISGEVGMRKPNPEIFAHTLKLLGVEPGAAVFVDDAVANIEGARRAGLQAVLHIDVHETRSQLARHVAGLNTTTPQLEETP